MGTLIDLLKAFWRPIAGLLAGLLVLFQRWRNRRLKARIDQQNQVIRGHQAKDEVHRQDREIDADADSQINDLRGRVQQAETPEAAAQTVSDGLNEFFGGKK